MKEFNNKSLQLAHSFFKMSRYRKNAFPYFIPYKKSSQKYSSENYCSQKVLKSDVDSAAATKPVTLVDTTTGNVLGTRKAKNFSLKLSATNLYMLNDNKIIGTTDQVINFIFALVYLPEGIDPSQLVQGTFPSSTSLYEPNQNVIMCGTISAGESKTISSRLARNLNYGDRIMLLIKHPAIPTVNVNGSDKNTAIQIDALLSYAICFN